MNDFLAVESQQGLGFVVVHFEAVADDVQVRIVEAIFAQGPALQAQKDFYQQLLKAGLDPEGAQETKTRTVLGYFAKTYR